MPIGTTSNMEWLSGPGGSSVEYTAGHGIIVDNYDHIISTDQSVVQDKLTAGEGITIQNNVISANPQRQSDWNQSDSSAVDYIRNKPTIPSGDQLVPSATSSDEGKILTVDSNGDPEWAPAQTYSQVQSNWNETDSSAVSYIQNKPSIPTATSDLTNDSNFITASDVPSAQVQSDWTESDTSDPAYIAHKPSIPTATSDLTNDSNFITASDVPGAQVQSDWTEADTTSAAYIAHKPSIPTVDQSYASSSNNAQSGVAVSQAISAVKQVPSSTSADDGKILTVDSNGNPSWAPAQSYSQVQSNWNETDSSAVSFIRNKPSIPTKTSDLTNDSNFITASDVPAQVQSDWTESNSSSAAYIAHKPNLATVATSGSYSDLSGKPTIPSGNQLLPSATSADSGKVLTVDSTGSPEWATGGGSTQVQSNWTEANTSAPAYIKNKPTVKNLIAGTGIKITETSQGIVISLA